MNLYGQRAMRHWEQFRAMSFGELDDPATFFSELGEQMATQIVLIAQTTESRERSMLNAMDDLARIGRLNAIKAQAEELVMAEMVYSLPLENDLSSLTPEQLEAKATLLGGVIIDGHLVPADPTHPWRVNHTNWTQQQLMPSPEDQWYGRESLATWYGENPERGEFEDQLEDLALASA